MSGDEKDKIESNNKEEGGIEMTVKVFRGGKFTDRKERKQVRNILQKLYGELQKSENEWRIYLDIEINYARPDFLLVNKEEDALIILELKNINGEITANLKKENEEWIDEETGEPIKYNNCKKMRPRNQCDFYRGKLVNVLKDITQYDDEDEWNNEIVYHYLDNIETFIVVPNKEKITLKNYDHRLKTYLDVLDEENILDITMCSGKKKINFEKLSRYIEGKATVPNSQEGIEELKKKEEIRQFWRELKESTDESTSELGGFELKSKRLENDLSSDYPKDVEKALEVSNYLDYETDKIYGLLNHENSEIRRITLEHLENIDESFSRDDLKDKIGQLIHDVDYSVRKKIDELVIKYGLFYTRTSYLEIIESSRDYSRVMDAVNVMKRIGDKSAAKKLIELYKNHQDRFGGLIEQKVTLTNGEDNDEKELRYYERLRGDRFRILESIKEIGCESVIESLVDLFENYEEKFGGLIEEKSKLEKEVRQIDWQSIDELKNDELIFSKRNLFSVIREIGGSDVIPFAKRYLDDPDFQKDAIEALGNSKDEKALSPLKELIENIEKKEGLSYRITGIQIIKALGKLGFEEGAEIIHEAIERKPNLFKRKEVKKSLKKIRSRKTFDFLIRNYELRDGAEVLIDIDKERFEEELFKKLEQGGLDEKSRMMGLISVLTHHYNFKISEDHLDRFIEIFQKYIKEFVKIDDELLDEIDEILKNNSNKRDIDRVVKNRGLKYRNYPKENIENFRNLISGSDVNDHLLAESTYLWKAEYEEKLPWDMIKEQYLITNKPTLRKLGLEILSAILYNHPEMAYEVEIGHIIELRDDPANRIVSNSIDVLDEDLNDPYIIENFEIDKAIISVLGFIGKEKSLEILLDYMYKDNELIEEVLDSLNRLKHHDNLQDYCKNKEKPIPEWFFVYDYITDLSGNYLHTFPKLVSFYWGDQVVPIIEKLLDENPEDKTLKSSIPETLSNMKYRGNEALLPLFRKLILDEDSNISSRTIRYFKEINDLHHSDDFIILKATEGKLDELLGSVKNKSSEKHLNIS